MTSLLKFTFGDHQIRTNNDPETPLFVAIDVVRALGYKDAKDALARHVSPEDLSKMRILDAKGRNQLVNVINESGLYCLIFGSKLEKAKEFKRWVTSEVLPSIRKTGTYTVPRKTITVEQQQAIRQAIAKRCKDSSSSYQTVYKALYNAFQIPRYTELLQSDFDKAIELIGGTNLNVPVCRDLEPVIPEGALVLDARRVEQLRITVYYYTELMRETFIAAAKVLQASKSPYAPRMCEAAGCFSIYQLKHFLEGYGIDTNVPRLAR